MELTEADIKKIEEEIDYRKKVLGPDLREKLKVARAQGDLSENFEYTMAKRNNNQNLSRIRYLENIVRTATVIQDTAPTDIVGLNKAVTFTDASGTEETVKIVSSIRGNSLEGRISKESPLGAALLNHKAGDKVLVRVNDKISFEVTIQKVVPVEDDGSDEVRGY